MQLFSVKRNGIQLIAVVVYDYQAIGKRERCIWLPAHGGG